MQEQRNKLTNNCSAGNEKKALYGPIATAFVSAKTGTWRIVKPVVDQEKCVGCGTCQKYCPTDVVELDNENSIHVTFDFDYCKGCGICANICPRQCISMIAERGE